VINRVKQKMQDIQKGLPKGVEIVTTYDRSDLIERAVKNLRYSNTRERAQYISVLSSKMI